jgi:predicted glycosyltransferase involved in capsule biosynthesis
MPFVSFIVGFRNRDTGRVRLFLESLNNQEDKDFEVVFVDYGSDIRISEEIKTLCGNYNFVNYFFFNTRGQTWNRGRCLNFGAGHSSAEHLFTSDIDFIFGKDFVSTLRKLISSNTCYYFKVGFLTQHQSADISGDPDNYKIESYSDENAIGALLIPKQIFDKLGGYDEFFELWGLEDNDLLYRIKFSGASIKFYSQNILIWHVWHLPVKKSDVLPEGWLKYLNDYFEFKKSTISKPDENYYSALDVARPLLQNKNNLHAKTVTINFNKDFMVLFLKNELQKMPANGTLEIKFDFGAFEQNKSGRLNGLVKKTNAFFAARNSPLALINKNMRSFLTEKEAKETLLYFIKNNHELVKDYYLPDTLLNESIYLMKK